MRRNTHDVDRSMLVSPLKAADAQRTHSARLGRVLPLLRRRLPRGCLAAVVASVLSAGSAAFGEYPVASTAESEEAPALARNTRTGEYLVAYMVTEAGRTTGQIHARRLTSAGVPIPGPDLGRVGPAIGRPAVAYDPDRDRFCVAYAVEEQSFPRLDHVRAFFVPGSGDDQSPTFNVFGPLGIEPLRYHSHRRWSDARYRDHPRSTYLRYTPSLNLVYNHELGEFVATCVFDEDDGIWRSYLWAKRFGRSDGTNPPPVRLGSYGPGSLLWAPSAGPVHGGRYLYANAGRFLLLDAQLRLVTYVPITFAFGDNGRNPGPSWFSGAYGVVEGRPSFLVVWTDAAACKPGVVSCPNEQDEWTGVWGTFIDPEVSEYRESRSGSELNTPFPISQSGLHHVTQEMAPNVAFDAASQSFYVAWLEVPVVSLLNDISRSHIRGTYIDYYIDWGLGNARIRDPHPGTVLSTGSGSCPTGETCYSREDPGLPAVAPASCAALVVFHRFRAGPGSDRDIAGQRAGIPCHPNFSLEEIALQSPLTGLTVRAGVGQGSLLAAVSPHIYGWETFRMHRLGGDTVALQSDLSGLFVRVGDRASGRRLAAVSENLTEWETFHLYRSGDSASLRSLALGKWVRAGVGGDAYLAAVSDEISMEETFILKSLGVPSPAFRRGDVNDSGVVDLSDGLGILGALYLGERDLPCRDAADSNDDGVVDLSDAVSLFAYLFLGATAPPSPGPFACGTDPTEDGTGCETVTACK